MAWRCLGKKSACNESSVVAHNTSRIGSPSLQHTSAGFGQSWYIAISATPMYSPTDSSFTRHASQVQLDPLPIESNLRMLQGNLGRPRLAQSASRLGTEQPRLPGARALPPHLSPFVSSHGCITHESGAAHHLAVAPQSILCQCCHG